MTSPADASSLSWEVCGTLARSVWTRVRAGAHEHISDAARAIGVNRSHVSRWESVDATNQAPLAVLWSRALVPDAQLDALVEQVRADRGDAAERAVLAAPDGALRRLMREANACVGRCIDILSDNRVSDAERLEALRMLAGLEETLTRTRLALIQAERTGGSR